jgi:DNA-binding NarL/FixJ family response regulator
MSSREGRESGVPLSVLIADDQPEVRSAMRLVVEQLVGYRVSAEAADVDQLLAAAAAEAPDVVLLDWELGNPWAGESLMSLLRKVAPSTHVVAMSARDGASSQAKAAGADGFVSKGDPPSRLIEALDGLW